MRILNQREQNLLINISLIAISISITLAQVNRWLSESIAAFAILIIFIVLLRAKDMLICTSISAVFIMILVLKVTLFDDYNIMQLAMVFYIWLSTLSFFYLFYKTREDNYAKPLLTNKLLILFLLIYTFLAVFNSFERVSPSHRYIFIFDNVLNFTGFTSVAYFLGSFLLRHRFFYFLIWSLPYSYLAIISHSKSIVITIIFSVFYILFRNYGFKGAVVLFIVSVILFVFSLFFQFTLDLSIIDFSLKSESNTLRLARYASGFDNFTFLGSGLEAFPSLASHLKLEGGFTSESYLLSLLLYSPLYFFSVMIFFILKNNALLDLKNILLIVPLFAGSFTTPNTLFFAIVALLVINYQNKSI